MPGKEDIGAYAVTESYYITISGGYDYRNAATSSPTVYGITIAKLEI
jgi:hypothetical protein